MARGMFIAVAIVALIVLSCSTALQGGMLNYSEVRSMTVYAPAVTSGNTGIMTNITLAIAYPGMGRVFFSALPFTELDTQAAARVAAWVAANLVGANFSSYDYFVLVESNTPIIGGPSASALMTVGFLALLTNASLLPNATMTGMIDPDGSVGPVGGLREKIEAAAAMGFKLFLIPYGQRNYTYPVVSSVQYPWGTAQVITYKTIDLVSYGKKLGIDVLEVKTVVEAYELLAGRRLPEAPTPPPEPAQASELMKYVAQEQINATATNLDQLNDVLNRIQHPQYRNYVASIAQQATSYYNSSSLQLSNGNYEYAASLSFESLYLSQYALWLAQYLAGNTSLTDVTNLVEGELNSTFNSLLNAFNDLMNREEVGYAAYELLADASTALVDAGYRLSTSRGAGTLSWLQQLAYARAEIYGASLQLSRLSSLEAVATPKISIALLQRQAGEVFALASAIYTYSSELSSEIGVTPSSLGIASSYFAAAANALNLSYYPMSLGSSVMASAYSTIALHEMVTSGQPISREFVASVGSIARRLLGYASGRSIMAYIYYNYGAQALSSGDLEESLAAFSASIMYSTTAMLVTGTGAGVAGPQPTSAWVGRTSTPAPTSTKPTMSPATSGSPQLTSSIQTPSTTPSATQAPARPLEGAPVLVVALVAFLVVLLTVALIAIRRAGRAA
ncbi:MAG: S16 family serine protease [Desulfurococcaceae archaeon]